MKTSTIIFILLVLAITKIQAQDYLISFAAIGDTSVVTTVYVENLTSGATLVLNGSDILHLTPVTGIADPDFANQSLQIYPNPMAGQSQLKFDSPVEGNAVITLVDLSGRLVCQFSKSLSPGLQTFRISGIKLGMYFLKVTGNNYSYSSKLLSQSNREGEARIEYVSSVNYSVDKQLKNSAATIEMPYTEGDRLLYKISSGKYSAVTIDVPTGSKTITSNFVASTDADNNSYSTVKIGNQVWMAENLKTTRYNDGTSIPRETDNTAWQHLSTPAIAWLNNDSSTNHNMYGVLYNGFAVGTGKLAPKGWHIPTDAEWDTLVSYLGGSSVAGGKLKESGTSHWLSPNTGASNESGFTALPGSEHEGAGSSGFGQLGNSAWWWSSTQNSSNNSAGFLSVSSDYESIFKMSLIRTMGFSVRCIKDELDTLISTKLTGGTSKTWVVDPSIPAHFGVGPWDNSSVAPAWWATQVNEKLSCCPCFYTSKFTFTKVDDDNYSLTVATPDGAYTKTGALAGGLPGIPASGDEACYSYAGGTSEFSLIQASSGIQAPVSTKTSIHLAGVNTFIGYGATLKEYEILQITDTTLYLRVQGTETGNAWYLKLKKYMAPVINNTTWDVTIYVSSIASYHADVTFYADGTTKYDEPSSPGSYLSYGTWTLTDDKIHWVLDSSRPNIYLFDGTVINNTMSGTYTFASDNLPWSAVKK
jgi:uncharacterized protein (TIGR02145 family)